MTYITGKPAGAQTSGDSEYTLVVNPDGSLNTKSAGSVGATTYANSTQVSVTSSTVDLVAAGVYKVVILRALSANTLSVFWGTTGVTVTTGAELKPGEEQIFTDDSVPVNLLRGVAASGTQTVIVTTGT